VKRGLSLGNVKVLTLSRRRVDLLFITLYDDQHFICSKVLRLRDQAHGDSTNPKLPHKGNNCGSHRSTTGHQQHNQQQPYSHVAPAHANQVYTLCFSPHSRRFQINKRALRPNMNIATAAACVEVKVGPVPSETISATTGPLVTDSKDVLQDDASYASFDEMPLHATVLRGVYSAGFERPSPIQRHAIVPVIRGGDVIAQGHSGTGKTAAFSIGVLQCLNLRCRAPQALILSPTRELAEQTQEVFEVMGAFVRTHAECHLSSLFVGQSKRTLDMQALHDGVLVAIGTPGRVTDLITRGALRVDKLRTIVLDEADELLSQSFANQVYEIFRFVPRDVQICLFSATMPQGVLDLCTRFMRNPTKILLPQERQTLEGIKQFYVSLDDVSKFGALMDLYESVSIAQSVVFCNTRRRVEWLAARLSAEHHTVASLHATMDAAERNTVMRAFKRGESRVLVTTDLVARGIDVQHVNYVVNFDVPLNTESYVHRIGRSGRYGRRGIAISFVAPQEVAALRDIEEHYHTHIAELPEDFAHFLDADG
jgi:translation initiation factor 4A